LCSMTGLDESTYGCCNQLNVYNKKTDLCCFILFRNLTKSKHDDISNYKCCGVFYYDIRSNYTCFCNEIVEKSKLTSFTKCCGRIPYDPRKQVCCSYGQEASSNTLLYRQGVVYAVLDLDPEYPQRNV